MHIPFLDLNAHHEPIRAEIDAAIQAVIDASAFAGGPFVTRFEENFAAFCGCAHAVGVSNGTEAILLTLQALEIGPGDEVITVPSTFMATVEAISRCGSTPVFVDIEEETYTLDPSLLEAAITPRTKAIIPVHLFGQMADMEVILEIASRFELYVIEDACQAHGAKYKGKAAGSFGIAGCFSFYPGKNLGGLGEGGAVVTNDAGLKRKVEMLRDHGQSAKYHHDVIGWNARMDGIQGAVLQVKLEYLSEANARRRSRAALYDRLLCETPGIITPVEAAGRLHVYHLYVIRVGARDELFDALKKAGVSCGIHYPVPVHLQKAYRHLGLRPGSFPVAEQCAQQFLSLPMFPELTEDQIRTVAAAIEAHLTSIDAHVCEVVT